MRAADTNILVRLVTRDDEAQYQAAKEFIAGGVWVSVLTLAETMWVLESFYALTSTELAQIIQKLLDHKQVVLQDPDVVADALLIFRDHKGVDFSDCLMLEIARKAGHIPFGTFDRNLGKIAGTERL